MKFSLVELYEMYLEKISPFDERSQEELDLGGIGGDRMTHNGYAKY